MTLMLYFLFYSVSFFIHMSKTFYLYIHHMLHLKTPLIIQSVIQSTGATFLNGIRVHNISKSNTVALGPYLWLGFQSKSSEPRWIDWVKLNELRWVSWPSWMSWISRFVWIELSKLVVLSELSRWIKLVGLIKLSLKSWFQWVE